MSEKMKHDPEAEQVQEEVKETAEPEKTPEQEAAEEAAETAEPETAEALEQKIAELTDRLQRSMAEFDNYRKRTEKEKSARYEIGARSVIEKILPVIDNFERGLATVDAEQPDPFQEGMDKVYRQMMAVMDELGVVAIEAVGKPFHPDFHNAVMHVEDDSVDENIIVEEFQKGYTYKGTVVRYSMVKVAN